MPRVSQEAKLESHARILEEAARQFREQGVEATSVAHVMKAAGMTHGGFYRHFSSKDELAVAAIESAFEDILKPLEEAAAAGESRPALYAFIDMYLAEQHVENPGLGCPIVALGAEAARRSDAEQIAITEGAARMVEHLAKLIGGAELESQQRAWSLLSLLVGTVTLARLAVSDETRDQILMSAKQVALQLLEI